MSQKLHERDISTNKHVHIDRSILASYRAHAMIYFASLGIFMYQGRRTQRQQNHRSFDFKNLARYSYNKNVTAKVTLISAYCIL